MSFSSTCEPVVEFSNNNHQNLRTSLRQIELADRTSIKEALSRAHEEVVSHFGTRTTCQVSDRGRVGFVRKNIFNY